MRCLELLTSTGPLLINIAIPILTFNYSTKETNYLQFKKALGNYCIQHFREIKSGILTGKLDDLPQLPAQPANSNNNVQLHLWKTEYDKVIFI